MKLISLACYKDSKVDFNTNLLTNFPKHFHFKVCSTSSGQGKFIFTDGVYASGVYTTGRFIDNTVKLHLIYPHTWFNQWREWSLQL